MSPLSPVSPVAFSAAQPSFGLWRRKRISEAQEIQKLEELFPMEVIEGYVRDFQGLESIRPEEVKTRRNLHTNPWSYLVKEKGGETLGFSKVLPDGRRIIVKLIMDQRSKGSFRLELWGQKDVT